MFGLHHSHQKAHQASQVLAWAVLVLLTLTSFWFRDHGAGAKTAVAIILSLSFIKVFIVGFSFMELRMAPRALQLVFSGWCVLSCVLLLVLALGL